MINKLLLGFLMLFSGVWKSLGADVHQLKAILEAKLKMDDRTPFQMGRPAAKKKKQINYYSTLSAFIYAMFGIFYAFPLFLSDHDFILSVTEYYSFFLTMLWFSMVVGFSPVLIDTRDNLILLPRPINDRTLLLSRLLHILIYLLRMVIPMSIPGCIILGFMKGWLTTIFFFFPIFLLALLALFMVNALYLLIIKLAGPKKFKDIIGSFQIVLSVLMFATSYVMPRMFQSEKIMSITLHELPWVQWIPTYWLAGLWTWFYKVDFVFTGTKLLSIASILLPFIAIWATVKWLAPKFIHAISLGEGQEIVRYKPASKNGKSTTQLYKRLAALLNRNPETRAGFELAWLQTARNRAFKMKVYPSLAYIPIYFFFVVLSRPGQDYSHILERMSSPKVYLILLYMCTFALSNAAMNLIYSEQYKASWIFFAPAIERPGNIMSGALRAIIVKFYLPFTAVVAGFIIYANGWKILLEVLLTQFNVLIFVLVSLRASMTALPFSVKEQMRERGAKNIFRQLMVFMIIPILGGAHYLTIKFWLLKLVVYPLVLILFCMLWDSYKKTNWQAIIQVNVDE